MTHSLLMIFPRIFIQCAARSLSFEFVQKPLICWLPLMHEA